MARNLGFDHGCFNIVTSSLRVMGALLIPTLPLASHAGNENPFRSVTTFSL